MSMMTEQTTITEAFFAAWDSTTTPVRRDNRADLIKGSSTVSDESKLKEWCHLTIVPSDANRGDINSIKMVRYTGSIVVNVFAKAGDGTTRLLELTNQVMGILQHKDLNGVITRSAVVTNMGQVPGGSFYQFSVRVPYYRDQYFTN